MLIATATTNVDATIADVWDALVNPEKIREYMFGTTVSSEWKKGSPITWKGEMKGKQYADKGSILEITPEKILKYSHFSPLSGKEDKPENYHNVTIRLDPSSNGVNVTLTQDNNENEKSKVESEKNWKAMLDGLKKVVEAG